jgi:hypothetical protein
MPEDGGRIQSPKGSSVRSISSNIPLRIQLHSSLLTREALDEIAQCQVSQMRLDLIR